MRVGFIGCGNMAGAILTAAVKKNAVEKEDLAVFDKAETARKKAEGLGVDVTKDLSELCRISDILLLGVKPQAVGSVFDEIKDVISGKAVISICAGVPVSRLKSLAGNDVRVLRIMPNTPALVGEGAMAVCDGSDFNESEMNTALAILRAAGDVCVVDEKLMDAVTGLSGSGPAFVAMFIEALSDGGVKCGLSRTVATELAAKTVLGTAKMVLEEKIHPAVLKDMVSSPAGTTIEGVAALENGAFRASVIDAVEAATERSRELGK